MNNYEAKLKSWSNKSFIKDLKKAFPKAEVFLVGGIVRDSMLDRETKDADMVIRRVAKTRLEKFLSSQGKVNLVGKKFGVFKFKPKLSNTQIDIALPRTEHSISMIGSYKDFKINSNANLEITDDLSRRDFTINSMAWDIFKGELIDPFNGAKDLKKKTIRTVGEPKLRFKEDYSRILRAIRFSAQLNFKIESLTWKQIEKEIKKITQKIQGQQIVPFEIIAQELNKALVAGPIKTIGLLDKSGAMKVLMPDLLQMKKCAQPSQFHSGDVWQHTIMGIKNIYSKSFQKEFPNTPPSPELIWAMLWHDVGKPFTMTKTDRIRFNGHDQVSAQKFKRKAKELKLVSTGLDVLSIEQAIKLHMLPASGNIDDMKNTTIEKYFFSDLFPGQLLLQLFFTDIMATIPKNGKPNFSDYKKITSRIKKLKTKGKQTLPKPLVSGNDIIKKYHLPEGPKIGKLLGILREAQLSGEITTKAQGLNLIKKHL